jgi:SAM-dependent MidA family methyltransferase
MTVAAFMDLALYDPEFGYYARAARRTGRAGDFFTSVDVGSLFGELLEVQIAEMFCLLRASPELAGGLRERRRDLSLQTVDLVEAGAGDGRLAADILRAARIRDPSLYESIRLHLVEASAAARAAQPATLADVGNRRVSSLSALPDSFQGVLIANELLDALPTHQVVMREDGLREVYVVADTPIGHEGTNEMLRTVEGPPSTPALAAYLDRLGITLERGWRVEINLRAVEWIRDAARRLRRGFMIVIDYGHDARDLYSAAHAGGTLTTFADHRSSGPERDAAPPAWLQHPGEQDLTAHVDFTSIRAAAEAEGMMTIAFLDQTYFLLGILSSTPNLQSAISNQQFKVLVMPGGLGSTHKVLLLGKGVGTPALRGCSFKVRVT